MTVFRGCIDIHSGKVKHIVGGKLVKDDTESDEVETNFVSEQPSSYYAQLYKQNQVHGTHVIKLGSLKANDDAAREALGAWRGGLQIGGGITDSNAQEWIDQGASHVIVTSWLFPEGQFSIERLQHLSSLIGKEKLVVDLSCRRQEIDGSPQWVVAMNKWQTLTSSVLDREFFQLLSQYCDEFLVHAADVEGLCQGIDQELVRKLSEWSDLPVTYAGGARSIQDLETVKHLSNGKVDLTFGSALNIFGGNLVKFEDCVKWNKTQ